MRPLASVLALVLAAPLLAGCVSTSDDDGAAADRAAQEALASAAGWPRVDARTTLDLLRGYSEAFPYRQSGSPTHLMARDFLVAGFEEMGLEVVRQPFAALLTTRLPVGYEGENLIGIKWGTDRSRWVIVGAHYDVTEGAVFGAYDDGSGTSLVQKLAEAYADVPTDRTLAFVHFDQEERGLLGARHLLQSIQEGTFEHPVTLDAMIDLDMIGITWPHPAKLVCWQNSESLKAKSEEARKAVGVPDEAIEYREPKYGTSDGAVFIEAGIPTIYYWSNWDEVVLKNGQQVPPWYPFWHQADTYQGMVLLAGDEQTLEAGFQTVLDVVSPLLAYAASPAFQPDTDLAVEA